MKKSLITSVVALALTAALATTLGCSDDEANNSSNSQAPNANVGTDLDSGTSDAGTLDDTGTDPDLAAPDMSGEGCVQATVSGPWELSYIDDVSVEYSAPIGPEIEGSERVISLLFERYSPGPDVGRFDLSEGPDANFGTCAHCVFVRTDTAERAYYAEAGTLENLSDPYSRRYDFEVTGLRLAEADVRLETRESTFVEDGACIEFVDFDGGGVFPPSRWTCPDEAYNDNETCNCDCGDVDPDCGLQVSCLLGEPDCPEPTRLPVVGCDATDVCAFDPGAFSTTCQEPCDWSAQEGCSNGTCVYDYGAGDGDLCITDPLRVAPDVAIGADCPDTAFQIVCNVVDGFAQGHCGANGVCRSLCTDDAECGEPGHTCRAFQFGDPLGYCGPEPVDG